jgi:hypothetical protein
MPSPWARLRAAPVSWSGVIATLRLLSIVGELLIGVIIRPLG